MKIITQALLFVAAVAACGVNFAAASTAAPLEGIDWELQGYADEQGAMQAVLPGKAPSILFLNGKLHGSAGCNHYAGEYAAEARQGLSISKRIAATMMACAPAIAEQERRYLALLSTVSSYEISNDASLQLLNAQREVVLQFGKRVSATLELNDWRALGINNGKGGVVSSQTTGLASARFEDGRVAGTTGCNHYAAAYTTTGGQLSVSRAVSTRRICAEPVGIMEQEQQFLQALQRTRSYKIVGNQLEMRDDKGSLLLKFELVQTGE
jgi:heat shock protein HslJ